ncbi:MAG: excinuclease ABC subunit UvrC [Rikenellaceae bacterium]
MEKLYKIRDGGIRDQVSALPLDPGVYQFLNSNGEVIYVGKAKSLRRRVSSYFLDSKDHTSKVRLLVRQIHHIEHIVVGSEGDALLLENSLIKELQPKYNILLKDDKSYPWIVVTKERFPRVYSTRRLLRDGSQYFGPYSSRATQRTILDFIRDVVPLRTCKLNLSSSAIAAGRYTTCLQFHLGNCLAPCVGGQSEEEYQQSIELVVSVLKGDLRPVRAHITSEMERAAEELKFEQAQRFKERLTALDNYSHRSVIVSSKIVDIDVFSLISVEDEVAYCNFVRIRHGSIVGVYTVQLTTGLNNDRATLLSHAIQQILERTEQSLAREVIVEELPAAAPIFDRITFTIPKRGEKLDLLKFSLRSCRIYRAEQKKRAEIEDPSNNCDEIMASMKSDLMLKREPRHIECFDNSNLQGTNPVAACVVFRDGKPSTSEYRHFNIKSVVGADDFASMREVVRRRYQRMIDSGDELPDLIVVDGGKGQLSSAYSVLCDLGIERKVAIVGLAKRIEEVFYPNDPLPYYLNRFSYTLKIICHLRDEAHRFGITFHRKKRSLELLNSELDNIKGIGSNSSEKLLQKFGSIKNIATATEQELAQTIGASRAKTVYSYFERAKKENNLG